MDKQYTPHSIEQQWYAHWEKAGYFSPQGNNASYCIMLPPPNVTGSLHMGHGFQHTLMDALIRYHRMLGCNTLWQAGVDHAGIATQMVVERQLLAEGKSRHDLGREKFIEKVWEWKESAGQTITQQLRRMGSSIDWTRACFTLDEERSKAVSEVFIKLYEEGLIYRGKRLVNWDPKFHTAISDLEVVSEEEDGQLWFIRYPLVNQTKHIIIATTRPETLLGDAAVAVHPNDPRYQQLIGEHIALPLCNRTIPIIADEYVDPEFGSGCVKITPAHDFNDYEVGKRHHLPLINIFTLDARINENAPEAYRGMDRFEARKLIVTHLEQAGLIEKIEKYRLKVPRGDRSGEIIEPLLTDQWFVKASELAGPAIKAVESDEVKLIPDTWKKTYFQWLHNIEDWCISRQLWWGHRIPAWYDDKGNIYVGKNEEEIRKKHHLKNDIALKQDVDVLDTWFSSALWPFSTLGWPQETKELKTFYPTNVLVTGFDIIFFWVARMIMMGLKFTGKVPFKEVYITGLIRDAEGHKMSKTKGNVIDPIDVIDGITLEQLIQKRTSGLMQPAMAKRIEKTTAQQYPQGIAAYGTDALRFTFCALATPGRDIRFDLGRVEGYRNFCNKLWNAARYVLMTVEQHQHLTSSSATSQRLPDKWIISRLNITIDEVTQHFKNYRFDLLAQAIYEFTWNDYCDWYLEFSKLLLTDPNAKEEEKRATYNTLIHVFETLLRLIHPLMPFITEEIWQMIAPLTGKSGHSIMLQSYPQAETTPHSLKITEDTICEMEWLKTIITNIRNIRGEMNISPGKSFPLLCKRASPQDRQRFHNHLYLITRLAKLTSLTEIEEHTPPPPSATTFIGDLELYIPLSDLIDKEAEIARLNKELNKELKEKERCEAKLSNPDYRAKAPAHVIEKEEKQLEASLSSITIIKTQLDKLKDL